MCLLQFLKLEIAHVELFCDPRLLGNEVLRFPKRVCRFDHPYVVKLIDATLHDDAVGPCLILEYIHGYNLEQIRNQGSPSSLDFVKNLSEVGQVFGESNRAATLGNGQQTINLRSIGATPPKPAV